MLRNHLMIAYQATVVAAGLVALAFVVVFTGKSRESSFPLFCLFHALFTANLILSLLRRYLVTNLPESSVWIGYLTYAAGTAIEHSALAAAALFFNSFLEVSGKKLRALILLPLAGAAILLVLVPGGVRFDMLRGTITYQSRFYLASFIYLAVFSYLLFLGYLRLPHVRSRGRLLFFLPLLIFATTGYAETVVTVIGNLHYRVLRISVEDEDFFWSSIPFLLYSVFLVVYFNVFSSRGEIRTAGISDDFLKRYRISEREQEVLRLVVQGYSNRRIAEDLYISLATVKTHLHNLFQKTGADGRFVLIHLARGE
jgi:DNA-binding CsgD family transcriptional regulator